MNSRERLKELLADMYQTEGTPESHEDIDKLLTMAGDDINDIMNLYHKLQEEMHSDPRYKDIMAREDLTKEQPIFIDLLAVTFNNNIFLERVIFKVCRLFFLTQMEYQK